MSYILDALKKSEQNRGNESIPNVQTIHSSSLSYHQEKRPLWPWAIVIVLIANIFILIYLLKPEAQHENTVSNSEVAPNVVIEQKIAPVLDVSTTQEAEIPVPVLEQKPSIPQITEPAVTTAPIAPRQTVDIDALPTHIRQQIPELIFSAHVYSSEPMQRSLVINNSFMEEGDAVSYDLTLVEITANGAIFDFRDYRFSTSVLSGWGSH